MRVADAAEAWLRRHAPAPVLRLAYRVGFWVLKPWWFVARPRTTGVKAVVRHGDRVLMLRHAYGRRRWWDLPGGYVHEGEEPAAALCRELEEELGVRPVAARLIATVPSRADRKRELLHVYAVDVDGQATRPDTAEVAHVRWVAAGELPDRTTPFVRRMIARSFWEPGDDDEQ